MRARRLSALAVGTLAAMNTVTPIAQAAAGRSEGGAAGPAAAQPASAPPNGTVEPMTFRRGTQLVSAAAGATDGPVLVDAPLNPSAASTDTNIAWSPLGFRLFFPTTAWIASVRPDGSDQHLLTKEANGTVTTSKQVTISPDGSTMAFVGAFGLVEAPTDGSDPTGTQLTVPGKLCEGAALPHFAPDGSLLVTCYPIAGTVPGAYRYARGVFTPVIANATQAVPSPDGSRIAFLRPDPATNLQQVFTVGADGVSGLTQLTHEANGAAQPTWSPDGKYLAYVDAAYTSPTGNGMPPVVADVVEIPASGGAPVGFIPHADNPAWTPPIATAHVVREAGQDRLGTAVAASQANFAARGDAADPARAQAGAVVLARSDTFADALGGSALAVRKDAPLLITPTGRLDPAVEAEIRRVLAPGGTVYLLGGEAALSPAVAKALSGFAVVRLSGANRYATAVAIATAIDPHPKNILIATGDNYPDALAAGATGAPVVLTSGATMPPETAAYLNTFDPSGGASYGTNMITVGGPADAALIAAYQAKKMPSWPPTMSRIKLAGDNRYATALLVAETFFGGTTDVAFATGASWPDALSGGAMVGHRGGPLLLVDPAAGVSPGAMDYLLRESGSISTVHLLGGQNALPSTVGRQAAGVIGVSGHVQNAS